jgi:hypothetical protein
MNDVHIQVLSVESSKFLSFAKHKLRKLDRRRRALGNASAKQFYTLGDVYLQIYTSDTRKLIRLWGGGGASIVFASAPTEIQLSVYDYITDTLTPTESFTNSSGTLHQYFNSVCHYNDTKNTDGKSVSPIPALPGGTPVHYYSHEVEYVQTAAGLYLRTPDDALLQAVSFPQGGVSWMPQFSRGQGNFISMPRYPTTEIWNLNRVSDIWAYAPSSTAVLPTHHWVPSFFFAEPGNAIYGTGWQYGKFLEWWVEPPDDFSIKDGRVTYGGMLENRKQTASAPYGYCETLTKLDTTDYFLVSFFESASPFPTESNPSWVNQKLTGTKQGGSSVSGKSRSFSIDALADFGVPSTDPTIHWWNAGWEGDTTPPAHDLTGVVITANGKSILYRYTGATTKLYTTTDYHSHAVSTSGRYAAIFEGTSLIERAIIADLQENTILRISEVPAGALGLSGAWIPRAVIDPLALPYDISNVATTPLVDEDTYKFRSHYGAVTYPEGDNAPTANWKMTCEDGVHARVASYDDPCFELTLVKILPLSVPPSGNVTVTMEGEVYAAGSFTELTQSLPYILFSSMGPPPAPYEIVLGHWTYSNNEPIPKEISVSATNARVEVIERAAMSMYQDIYDKVYVKNALGTVARSGFDENGEVTVDTTCGAQTVSATTSCGQSASLEVGEDPATLTITAPDNVYSVGDVFSAGGGVEPYTYSTSVGTIDPDTGEVLTYTGHCGRVTVTATDACGQTASTDVRGSSGTWWAEEKHYFRFDTGCTFDAFELFGAMRWKIGCRTAPGTGDGRVFSVNPINNGGCPDGVSTFYESFPAPFGNDIPVSDFGICSGNATRCAEKEQFDCC